MPSRRTYLASLASACLAGCIGNSPGSTTDPTTDTVTTDTVTTDTVTTAPASASRPEVAIETATVQYNYRHIDQVDWNGIRTADGQFVFVTVDAREAEQVPRREAFGLESTDERHDPIETGRPSPVDIPMPGLPYVPEEMDREPRGWLLFDVPAQLDAAPSLRLADDTGSWKWELDTEKSTTPPPAWEWTASGPETVASDETFDIKISAANIGNGPGTFRGAVNFSFPMYKPEGFDIALAAGESGEATVSASSRGADPGTELEYGVRTPTGREEIVVTVQNRRQ